MEQEVLTVGQRAVLAARSIAEIRPEAKRRQLCGLRQYGGESSGSGPDCSKLVAGRYRVGARSVRRAKRLIDDGAADLVAAIEAGEMTLGRAETISLNRGTQACVYFLQSEGGGPIKIGYTDHLARRVEQIQLMCPYKLRVIGTMSAGPETERGLHRDFAHLRLHGEWFSPAEELETFVAEVLCK